MGIRDDPTCSIAVSRVLKQRLISYGSAASVLRFDIRFGENFIYTLYTLINAEPCEIHSKITGVLITYRSLVYH